MCSWSWRHMLCVVCFCFFFNDTATTEIYTLSLHDALPISWPTPTWAGRLITQNACCLDRKSTRLNSSHLVISYAVFCLKKKKTTNEHTTATPTQLTPPTATTTHSTP